jgi:ISXO2-like transposase domain
MSPNCPSQEYVRGQVHTQGIENFWSLLKRGLRGTYVAVEPFHLHAYVDDRSTAKTLNSLELH